MYTDGGKVNRQSAIELHASLDGVYQLRNIGMARVEAGVRVDNSDDGS